MANANGANGSIPNKTNADGKKNVRLGRAGRILLGFATVQARHMFSGFALSDDAFDDLERFFSQIVLKHEAIKTLYFNAGTKFLGIGDRVALDKINTRSIF